MTDEQITALNDHKKGCEGRTYTCTCGYDDAQAAEIARLREAKWIVRHADTANDMVLIGMARDSAIAERDAARDENARLRELVHLYVDRSNVRLEHRTSQKISN
jgi:hypothetical protein